MYTRSSSRRAFSCASRIASRYVIVIEPKVLRRFVELRRDTKFLWLDLRGVHAEHRPQLVLPVASRFFSSSRAMLHPPTFVPADSSPLPSGNRGRAVCEISFYPCRRRHHVPRGRSVEGSFLPPIVDHVRLGLVLSRAPALRGSRGDRSRPRIGLPLRS